MVILKINNFSKWFIKYLQYNGTCVLESTSQKAQPKEIIYKYFKIFEIIKFKNDKRTIIKSVDNRHPEVCCIKSVLKQNWQENTFFIENF